MEIIQDYSKDNENRRFPSNQMALKVYLIKESDWNKCAREIKTTTLTIDTGSHLKCHIHTNIQTSITLPNNHFWSLRERFLNKNWPINQISLKVCLRSHPFIFDWQRPLHIGENGIKWFVWGTFKDKLKLMIYSSSMGVFVGCYSSIDGLSFQNA